MNQKLLFKAVVFVLVGCMAMPVAIAAKKTVKGQKMKISAIQYPLQSGMSESAFFEKMEAYILQAKANGSDLVVFPELNAMDVVKSKPGNRQIEELVQISKDFTPRYFKWIDDQAKKTGMMILGGSAPRWTADGVTNAAIFAFPSEREPVIQDKLNLTPDEKAWKWINGSKLNVFDTPFGRMVILICYDSQFSSVSTALMTYKPDLILVPSWTGPKGFNRVRWTSQARAIEHYAYVVVAGTVDPHNPQSTEDVGQVAMIPPQDAPFPVFIAEGPFNTPAIVHGELDFGLLKKARANAGLFSARDDLARTTIVEVVEVNCDVILR